MPAKSSSISPSPSSSRPLQPVLVDAAVPVVVGIARVGSPPLHSRRRSVDDVDRIARRIELGLGISGRHRWHARPPPRRSRSLPHRDTRCRSPRATARRENRPSDTRSWEGSRGNRSSSRSSGDCRRTVMLLPSSTMERPIASSLPLRSSPPVLGHERQARTWPR